MSALIIHIYNILRDILFGIAGKQIWIISSILSNLFDPRSQIRKIIRTATSLMRHRILLFFFLHLDKTLLLNRFLLEGESIW